MASASASSDALPLQGQPGLSVGGSPSLPSPSDKIEGSKDRDIALKYTSQESARRTSSTPEQFEVDLGKYKDRLDKIEARREKVGKGLGVAAGAQYVGLVGFGICILVGGCTFNPKGLIAGGIAGAAFYAACSIVTLGPLAYSAYQKIRETIFFRSLASDMAKQENIPIELASKLIENTLKERVLAKQDKSVAQLVPACENEIQGLRASIERDAGSIARKKAEIERLKSSTDEDDIATVERYKLEIPALYAKIESHKYKLDAKEKELVQLQEGSAKLPLSITRILLKEEENAIQQKIVQHKKGQGKTGFEAREAQLQATGAEIEAEKARLKQQLSTQIDSLTKEITQSIQTKIDETPEELDQRIASAQARLEWVTERLSDQKMPDYEKVSLNHTKYQVESEIQQLKDLKKHKNNFNKVGAKLKQDVEKSKPGEIDTDRRFLALGQSYIVQATLSDESEKIKKLNDLNQQLARLA